MLAFRWERECLKHIKKNIDVNVMNEKFANQTG